VYGWICLFGAGIFVIIQLVLLIEFSYSWNETWLRYYEEEEASGSGSTWYYLLLGATFLLFGGAIALTGVMYKFFSPTGCNMNATFITLNLIAGLILCTISLHPKVREMRPTSGLLQSSIVFLYTTYLIWSAMMSEPGECNPFDWSAGTKVVSLIMGASFTIVSVVYSTIRTAGSSEELLGNSDVEKAPLVSTDDTDKSAPAKMDDDEEDTVTYNHSYFHLSFALGAMYICMLLTNWQTLSGASTSDSNVYVDKGMASVWIKVVSGWVTFFLYSWTLLAPVCMPNRDWS